MATAAANTYAIRLVMSISLKVVSMAAVFCASFSLSAVRSRMRDIFTRVTPGGSNLCAAVPVAAATAGGVGGSGVGAGGVGAFAGAAGAGAGAGAGAAAAAAAAAGAAAGVPSPPATILKMGPPTWTVSPSAANSSVMVPATGAGTLTTVLSVSIVATWHRCAHAIRVRVHVSVCMRVAFVTERMNDW